MSTTIMEEQLHAALAGESALRDLGCAAERHPSGGVAVKVGQTDVGTWEWRGGLFIFTPAMPGRREHRVETVAEAVRLTQAIAGNP